MAQTAANVRIDKPVSAGAVWVAPRGTPLPATIEAPLDAAFKSVGYLMQGGITRDNTRDSSQIVAFGGDVVAIAETTDNATAQFVMIETNEVSLKLYHGSGNVSTTSGVTKIRGNATPFDHWAMVIDLVSGSSASRLIAADAYLSARGTIVHQDADATARDTTFTFFPHADLGGDKWQELVEGVSSGGVARLFSVDPATAVLAGGSLHLLAGSGFTGLSALTVGGTSVSAANRDVVSDSRISFIAPANTAGAKAVVVTTSAGDSTDTVEITYA